MAETPGTDRGIIRRAFIKVRRYNFLLSMWKQRQKFYGNRIDLPERLVRLRFSDKGLQRRKRLSDCMGRHRSVFLYIRNLSVQRDGFHKSDATRGLRPRFRSVTKALMPTLLRQSNKQLKFFQREIRKKEHNSAVFSGFPNIGNLFPARLACRLLHPGLLGKNGLAGKYHKSRNLLPTGKITTTNA